MGVERETKRSTEMASPNIYFTNGGLMPAAGSVARSVRTLVVDDAPGILQVFSSVLSADPRIELAGTAANGLAAVTLARTVRPDLIFMDVNMPVMSGLKAAMHIKERVPATKIVLMSADHDPAIALAAMDCGADGFLPKSRWANYAWHVYRLFLSPK
jgi:CheY-like chemotaxis protein